jgi:hypothetical protein
MATAVYATIGGHAKTLNLECLHVKQTVHRAYKYQYEMNLTAHIYQRFVLRNIGMYCMKQDKCSRSMT